MPLVTDPESILNEFKNVQSYNGATPFSSQRWRYFVENAGVLEREFIQYGSSQGFSDSGTTKQITTDSDRLFKLKTANSFTLQPKSEILLNFNFKIDRSLDTNERLVVGFGNADLENGMTSANGWFLEFEPSMADNEALFSIYRDGNVVNRGGSKTPVTFSEDITNTAQITMVINPGLLSTAVVFETFDGNVDSGRVDERVAKVSTEGTDTPGLSSGPIQFSIRGGGISLDVGDVSVKRESKLKTVRQKEYLFESQINTADTWVPAEAFRIDPNRPEISVDIRSINPAGLSQRDIGFISVGFFAFHQSNVTFSNTDSWSTSDATSSINDALQTRGDIDQVANSTGSLTTNPADIGGIQVKKESSAASRDKLQNGLVTNATQNPQPLTNGDIGIFAVQVPDNDGAARYLPVFEQKW